MDDKIEVTSLLRGRKLKRELTLLPLTGLIYFTVCGGAFGIEGLVSSCGPGLAILMLILVPAIFSIPNMLIARELLSLMPHEGGSYHWIKKAFGPLAGFMAGWGNWIVSFLDVALYPLLAYKYLLHLFPALAKGPMLIGVPVYQFLISGIIIWGMSFLQINGAKLTGWVNNGLAIICAIPLFAMGFIGLWYALSTGVALHLPFLPMEEEIGVKSLSEAFSAGIVIILWNYMGWELPAAAGSEIMAPKKTYPHAMALVLMLTVATYMIPILGGLYGITGQNDSYMAWGREASSEAGIGADLAKHGITEVQISSWGANIDSASQSGWKFTDIAQIIGTNFGGELFGQVLGALMTLAAVISMIGLFAGNSLGGTRIPFALAEDGMFPQWMTKVHPKYGTPYVTIIVTAFIYWIFATCHFSTLIAADVFLSLAVIALELLAVWVLRFTLPERPRNMVPGGWIGLTIATLLPLTVIVIAIGSRIMVDGLKSISIALALMAVGLIAYVPFRSWIKKDVPDVDPFLGDPEES